MRWVSVAKLDGMVPGEGRLVEVEGEDVGLFLVDDRVYAIDNTCPHREGYLHEGQVEGTTVTCPWHFTVFCLRTGSVLEGPSDQPVRTYEVQVEGNDVQLGFRE